jgi:uncharacterized protein
MPMRARRQALPGNRWHLQHGPIDVVIAAEGDAAVVAMAHERAWARFQTLLDELVAELALLRRPVVECRGLRGRVARRMWQACAPHAPEFITPMAAVAGAVAQELIEAYGQPGIRRAWVNNGGDIALHLAPGERTTIGLFADLSNVGMALAQRSGSLALDGRFSLCAEDGVCGVATSGWRGRSHSLGIADSVTVLAATAAQADAAATMIANAVNVDAPGIVRRPACELRDDSDLGERLVTVQVPVLSAEQRAAALRAGAGRARRCCDDGLIAAAALVCQGECIQVGALALSQRTVITSDHLALA